MSNIGFTEAFFHIPALALPPGCVDPPVPATYEQIQIVPGARDGRRFMAGGENAAYVAPAVV
jgi:hypothetical protein